MPSWLFGGQKQRVALARALANKPGVLAPHEPLGALDAPARISMQQLLNPVRREQRFTAVLVTHDVNEALHLADRVVVLDEGRIAMDDPKCATGGEAFGGDPGQGAVEVESSLPTLRHRWPSSFAAPHSCWPALPSSSAGLFSIRVQIDLCCPESENPLLWLLAAGVELAPVVVDQAGFVDPPLFTPST